MISRFILFSFFILGNSFFTNAQDLTSFFQKTNHFLKIVVHDGQVDYTFVKNNKNIINELTNIIATTSPDNLSPSERKAYLINAYNLLVIKSIADRYPLSTTQTVNGFFDKIKHNIGGHAWTLNELENDQIRKIYHDPRVHFVLNCGAVSCPPVANFAYTPEQLEDQLNQQTQRAFDQPDFIYQKNGKNYISSLFKWYKADFTKNGTVIEFINKYRTQKLSTENRTVHYPYDWTVNELVDKTVKVSVGEGASAGSFIQSYTPSSLLKKGQLELQLFNNLYTQTAFRNENREKVNRSARDNYFTGLVNINYGVSNNRRLNVGLDINFRSVHIDTSASSSPLKVFSFGNDTLFNRTAISSMGPTVKFVPFPSIKLSVKSAFLIPIAKDGETTTPLFDYNRFTWWNQFFYDKNIGSNWQLFFEADLLFRFAKSADKYIDKKPKRTLLDTPVSTFVSYFPTEKSTIYFMLQYSPRFGLNDLSADGLEKISNAHYQGDYAQTGIGFKYQVLPRIGLEFSYTNFFTSKNQGAGNTFNFGIRYID